MTRFVAACRLGELSAKRGRRFTRDDHDIALWRIDGVVHAVGNVCSHQHIPALHQGTIEGDTVRCPMHGWRYELETGSAVEGSGRIPVYPVRIAGEVVSVGLPDDGSGDE